MVCSSKGSGEQSEQTVIQTSFMTSHKSCDWLSVTLLIKAVRSLQENSLDTCSTTDPLREGELQNHFIHFGSSAISLQSSLYKQFSLRGEKI